MRPIMGEPEYTIDDIDMMNGKEFEEFQTNPRLEKAVAIIRVEVNEYTCKKHMRD